MTNHSLSTINGFFITLHWRTLSLSFKFSLGICFTELLALSEEDQGLCLIFIVLLFFF